MAILILNGALFESQYGRRGSFLMVKASREAPPFAFQTPDAQQFLAK